QLAHQESLTVHGAEALVGAVKAGAQPPEVGTDLTVDDRAHVAGGGHGERFASLADDGPRQLFGRLLVESSVYIGEVLAEQIIEFDAICGFMLRPVPPAPIAALGNEELFVSQLQSARWTRGGRGRHPFIELARGAEEIPGAIVFVRADPNIEV